jgi:chorismate mutase
MSNTPTLQDLRSQIDEIDRAIHDLLMRRTEVVQAVSARKAEENRLGNGAATHPMRPGREAQVLRRLITRHSGALPVETLVAIWRELMSAMTRLQGPLEIAVYGGADPTGCWDLARAHFGAATPMTLYQSAGQVLRALGEKPGVLGVLPLGTEAGAQPWWPHLLGAGEHGPCIVARLPFVRPRAGAPQQREAVVIGSLEREPTGEDVTFLVVAADPSVSRANVALRLAEAGLAGQSVETHEEAPQGSRLHLVQVPDYVTRDDERLSRLAAGSKTLVHRIAVVGGYAQPLDPDRPLAEAAAAAS